MEAKLTSMSPVFAAGWSAQRSAQHSLPLINLSLAVTVRDGKIKHCSPQRYKVRTVTINLPAQRTTLDHNFYVLDAHNRIIEVGGCWNEFAVSNDGASATSARVLGRSVWEFIAGTDTVAYLNAIFFQSRRTGRYFRDIYRCDSEGQFREFQMEVIPAEHGVLRVHHFLIRTGLLPTADFEHLQPVSARRCSACCSYELQDHWVDRKNHQILLQASDYVVCPNCKRNTRDLLSSDLERGYQGYLIYDEGLPLDCTANAY